MSNVKEHRKRYEEARAKGCTVDMAMAYMEGRIDPPWATFGTMGEPVAASTDLADALNEAAGQDTPEELDLVHSPGHYRSDTGMECREAIRAQLGRDGFVAYCHGNAAKYLWRWQHKGGIQDLDKAAEYLGWMREELARKS